MKEKISMPKITEVATFCPPKASDDLYRRQLTLHGMDTEGDGRVL